MASWTKEEDDYMSDSLLAKCDNRRPGLVPAHVARQHKQAEKAKLINQNNRMKPRKVMEAEKREQGLNNALDSSNKGFALLQKMGYKPGMTMGKSGSGRSEPVPINFRAGRSGLGHETEAARKRNAALEQRKFQAAKRMKMAEQRQRNFQEKQSERFFERLATKDLYKSQRVCEQLDSQKGMTEPAEKFFWPANLLPNKNEEAKPLSDECDNQLDNSPQEKEEESDEEKEGDEEDLLTPAEKLEILTMYLRNRHLYCVWCGTTFSDKADLTENCPGNTAEAHED